MNIVFLVLGERAVIVGTGVTVAGFYASLAYIAAAMQYMFATGDTVLTMTARSPRTRNTMFIIPQMSKYWRA